MAAAFWAYVCLDLMRDVHDSLRTLNMTSLPSVTLTCGCNPLRSASSQGTDYVLLFSRPRHDSYERVGIVLLFFPRLLGPRLPFRLQSEDTVCQVLEQPSVTGLVLVLGQDGIDRLVALL